MAKIVITGGEPLNGDVWISGAKNAVLPILAATLLADEPVTIGNVPHLHDVTTTMELLGQMGVQLTIDERMRIHVDPRTTNRYFAPYDLVKTMRASILVLGPLVARFGEADVSLPGGCAIGSRPVNLHIRGLQALGAEVFGGERLHQGAGQAAQGRADQHGSGHRDRHREHHDGRGAGQRHDGHRKRRAGTRSRRSGQLPQCDGRAASAAPGRAPSSSTASNACTEPITTCCPTASKPVRFWLPERSPVAGCWPSAHGPKTLDAVLHKLEDAGAQVNTGEDWIEVDMRGRRPQAVDITTAPYPAFPTDMQAQFTALNAVAEGVGTITENVFENRFMHVHELERLGADIRLEGNTAVIKGVDARCPARR